MGQGPHGVRHIPLSVISLFNHSLIFYKFLKGLENFFQEVFQKNKKISKWGRSPMECGIYL